MGLGSRIAEPTRRFHPALSRSSAHLAQPHLLCQAGIVPTCHVCKSSSFERLLSRERDELTLNRCRSCGFVYLSSWEQSVAKSEQLYDYYEQLGKDDLASRYSKENVLRQQQLLKGLARYTRGRRLLDVGCGDGQLLQTATDEGWHAVGIDLSKSAVRLCVERGLSATNADFFDVSLDDERFDVIAMSELLEHVPSPQRFLRRAEELLEDDGILYLTTPNFGSLARRMLDESWSVIHPEHIGYFERTTLRKMAAKETSLRELRVDANNIAPSTFVAWWGRRRAQSIDATARVHRERRQGLDQRVRGAIRQWRLLGMSKDLLNRVVSAAGLGDTLVAWLQKPPA